MKKRTGKMISLSLAVAMAMTAAPVTALAVNEPVQKASELTRAQNEGEKETGTTTVDTKEEEEPATVVATPEALTAGDAEAVTFGEATTHEANSQESLEKAIKDAQRGDTIKLTASFEVTNDGEGIAENEALFTLPTGVTLDGNGKTITATDWVKSANNHIVGIVNAKDTKICNLTIVGNKSTKHGINVFGNNGDTSMDIENVTVKDCGTAGIVVNGATVTATDITTENNAWGAINVDKAGEFTLKGDCDIAEANKVWSENESVTTIDVSEVDDWVTMKTDAEDNKTYYTDLEDINTVLIDISEKYENVDITLNKDVELSETVTINVVASITIDGKNKTIKGNNSEVYPAFVIKKGTFNIKNVNVTEFGGNVGVASSNAVFSVPAVAAAGTSFTAENVNVSDFNRTAFDIRSGNFTITGCDIDCANTYSQTPNAEKVLTKGILAGYGTNKVTGTVKDVTITGAKSTYEGKWDSAGIEIYTNADVTIDGGSITAGSTGIWIDNYYGDEDKVAAVRIQDVTVNAEDAVKVFYSYKNEDGTTTTGKGKAKVEIKSGNFTGAIRIVGGEDSTTNNIDISGGKFTNPGSQINDFLAPGFSGEIITGSSSGGSHKFDNYITVITPKNGEVSVSDDWAYVGDKVTLTVTPDKGYVVDKIEIVDDEGDKIDAKKVDDEDNKYTFRMANCDVTVTVTFKEEGKTTEDTDKEEDKDDEETTELNFTDVKESDWFYKGVAYVVDKGVMSGVSENQFDPSGKLTRAMLVQMLYNMESRPACDAENAFMDVPVGQWYTDAVIWANDAKIVSGMGEGLFAPNMEITREQMVVMLYNYAKYKGYDVTASADLSKFADNASVSTWAQPAMQWAVAEGYISGMGDNQLAPQGTATRAEIASVIMRFMEATAESAETAE